MPMARTIITWTTVPSADLDRQTLYITEALSGDILTARLPVAGTLMYGLQ